MAELTALGAARAPWAVGAFKTLRGREGLGFQFSVKHLGKAVASVSDYGDGGSLHIHWSDRSLESAFHTWLLDYARKAGVEKEHRDWMVEHSIEDRGHFEETVFELGIQRWANDHDVQARLARWCRTKVVFQVGDQIGTDRWTTIRGTLTPEVRAMIERYHAGKTVRFANDEVGR